MQRDDTAPATKKDIEQFVEHIQSLIANMEERMEERITKEGEETRRHFDVVAENIKHDFQGAFHDKLEQHEDRIVRLEGRVGLIV